MDKYLILPKTIDRREQKLPDFLTSFHLEDQMNQAYAVGYELFQVVSNDHATRAFMVMNDSRNKELLLSKIKQAKEQA